MDHVLRNLRAARTADELRKHSAELLTHFSQLTLVTRDNVKLFAETGQRNHEPFCAFTSATEARAWTDQQNERDVKTYGTGLYAVYHNMVLNPVTLRADDLYMMYYPSVLNTDLRELQYRARHMSRRGR